MRLRSHRALGRINAEHRTNDQSHSLQPQERSQFPHGQSRRVAFTDLLGNKVQFATNTIRLGIDVTNDLGATEQRQRVVAAHSFVRRGIDLPAIVVGPQSFSDFAIVEDGIERRKQQGFGGWGVGWEQGFVGVQHEQTRAVQAFDDDLLDVVS